MELGYGLFLHFGPNTFTAAGWGDGKFPSADFHPAELDTDQWADMAAAGGMKYAVLTTKHHDGFCLWPSRHTEYCTSLNPKWFWNEGDCYGHPSVETMCGWYRQARASQANFLLNAGPDKRGLMPEYHRHYLAAAAHALRLK